ncbi:chromate efflux transporter [Nocardiopsis sp. NRRL B-16309]|uniref:chromate efflux transporter n=1 Tax=Nocardiopsis sp. NRRL B-16309 TaxID=1519494 RepID=UPI0006AECDAF|nr:chromate efflux transporter [Nocardiopsis sp. NRRL B-16309]KOX15761.1 chromate transporter [Nocardiopsis sp. NRRL B-16309]
MSEQTPTTPTAPGGRGTAAEVFRAFLLLGLTSFGGPVAHLGYFREAFVARRGWLGEAAYADLVALCQFLPGPASSQVGMAIGLRRAGYAGMAAAWAAFTLPSAVLMAAFALGVQAIGAEPGAGWLLGLKAAAVAVVAHAVLGMATNLAAGKRPATIALAALVLVLLVPSALAQVAAIALGALAGLFWLTARTGTDSEADGASVPVRRRTAVACLAVFAVLLAGLPAAAALSGNAALATADGFYRAGSLVFGGGHVVLPLLETEVVGSGAVDHASFLAGYGAAQAVPGPLFTFSAYLGALMPVAGSPLLGAALALVAIFLPSALLVVGALPFWERLRDHARARRAMAGAGAAVVGVLAAALYDPVFLQGVVSPATMALAAVAFVALAVWRLPAWAVVVAAGAIGFLAL